MRIISKAMAQEPTQTFLLCIWLKHPRFCFCFGANQRLCFQALHPFETKPENPRKLACCRMLQAHTHRGRTLTLRTFACLIAVIEIQRCDNYSLGAREGRGYTCMGPTLHRALEIFIYSSTHLFKMLE